MKEPGEMAAFPRVFYTTSYLFVIMYKNDWQYKFYLYISKNTQIYLSLHPIYN